ncbi:hypothetical protein [Anatilimnocola aggregata]|uniref:hypothetical protein n=1 Tax=Anatilimnocola aggregata TaxID=2528021 RepID=UPI0011AA9651|nr:hypothetical protein [Anatilimnocola aggregata]
MKLKLNQLHHLSQPTYRGGDDDAGQRIHHTHDLRIQSQVEHNHSANNYRSLQSQLDKLAGDDDGGAQLPTHRWRTP